MIGYLVAATDPVGITDAMERGYVRVAYNRFVAGEQNAEKHDFRVIRRINDLVPLPGKTPLVRGTDYDEGPPATWGEGALNEWIKQREQFEAFVASGAGEWLEGLP